MAETIPRANDARRQRGQEIAQRGNQIVRLDDLHYTVRSQSSDGIYDVMSTEHGWTCACPDHVYRNVCCKHIHAVEISLRLRKEVEARTVLEPVQFDKCLYCKSNSIKKKGIRKNKAGGIQKYQCGSCGRYFSVNLGFERMRASPKVITSAMQLYFTGESLRGIQKFLRLQGVDMSHVAVYKWVCKYTKLMDEYLKTITPQVGDKWHADEVWLKIKGDRKYLFAMMDADTRFWIAQEVADSKFKHDARSLLKMGKEAAGKRPAVFVTDGLPAYRDAFNKEFRTMKGPRAKHVSDIHIKDQKKNNNIQERLNGEFRDREKVFRGLKKDDSPAIAGIRLHHNYVRPHMGLGGDTPADRAGIEIRGNDKWKTIIQNASLDSYFAPT